jgi:hypothetical protein
MGKIWVTGDIHGNPQRLSKEVFYEQNSMKPNDDNYVIICGDFGIIWNFKGETKEEKEYLDWLNNKPFVTLFVDGNHENHELLNKYPKKLWNGGYVHEIRKNVLHLMRGEIYTICNKTFFAFGGALSHDISDGILDPIKDIEKIKKWNNDYTKFFRINHITWWKEELPSEEEKENGLKNLKKYNYNVDFIITHSPSKDMLPSFRNANYQADELMEYLEIIRKKTTYNHWFCGHMHTNKTITTKDICLYEQIIRIL